MTTNAQKKQGEVNGCRVVDVCDSCLTVAYDAGIEDAGAQDYAMREAGEVLPDHLCDAKDEPEYFQQRCGCGCCERRPAPVR